MAQADGTTPHIRDTTVEFLRSFSVVEYDSEAEEDFDVLSPIPDTVDGNTVHNSIELENKEPIIPFRTIFKPAGAYDSYDSTKKENFWVCNAPININITCFEHDDHVINPYRYTIVVKHAEQEWTVHKRYKHFRQLHDALALFRAKHRIPFPRTGERRERQKTLRKELRDQGSVRFPLRPDTLIKKENINARMKQLECYLQNLLQCKSYRNHPETLKFFEVSHLSFVSRLGPKNKEGMVKKCSGGRRISIGCCGCLQKVHFAGTWNRRWLVLKDTCLAYIRPEDGVISDVMLMDGDFRVESGMAATGAKHGVLISNLNRNLLIKCWTSRKAREWAESIKRTAHEHAKDFTEPKRFNSFAPVREDSYARWFVDAKSYFEAVADALEKAKEEIYITDWWLSPEIYMKRPIVDGDRWRLDKILKRKAEEGVMVFILLYKEVEAALMIKSIYSKQILMQHPNIKVLRHPDHIPGKGVLLWAHHEKLVAVDQQIAFLGGIDLCYGRWDDAQHRLTDLGSIILKAQSSVSVSTKAEHSIVTDMTEVADEHKSCDTPVSQRMPSGKTSSKKSLQAVADHHDVDVVMPLSQPQQTEDSSENLPTKTERETSSQAKDSVDVNAKPSTEHVFASVVVHERRQTTDSHSQSTQDEDYQEKAASVTTASKGDASDGTDSALGSRSASADSKSSVASTGKKHLWARANGRPDLRLQIPKQGTSQLAFDSLEVDGMDSFDANKKMEPSCVSNGTNLEDTRLRSCSSTSEASKTSDSVLIDRIEREKVENTSAAMNGASGHDTVDFVKAARVMKVFNKLNHNKEEQNNNEGHSDSGHGDALHADGNQARRRWKLVINVQKFESVARHTQIPENIPAELLTPRPPSSAKEAKHWIPHSFRQKVHNRFKSERKSDYELSGIDSMNNEHEDKELWGVMRRTHSEQDILERGLEGSTKLWIGKDYVNFIYKDFVQLHQPFEDFIDRRKCPRMPWHDIGAVVYGKAARDVARHFIGRWNFTKLKKYKRNVNFPLLLPKQHSKMNVSQGIKDITYPVRCQILRSICGWSGGIEHVETSIHEAYEFCIENAKHYIYIENQFFITQVEASDYSDVSNHIGTALYKRILRAHRNKEDFKVYVMMPLMPAFEGEFGTPTGVALQAVTHWNYASICRGSNSLFEKLSTGEVPEPNKYIVFCGLRKWDQLNGKLVTELIYVHSKVMIIDDNTVIIGSANINDRSMLGKRDSELAVMIEDTVRERVIHKGRVLEPGRFGSSLRHTIFREHLGLSENDTEVDLMDLTSDSFFKEVWFSQAENNTSIFEKVFRCLPTDQVQNFQKLKQYTSEVNLATSDPKEAMAQLSRVKGHIVRLPLKFLCDENLTPKVGQKEALLPSYLWT
ncbi:hypothetical protein C0Q70_10533 [Pomacea canaliculata]|uniref:Phospholipase n=1 Tax=Pomacea canaliculata TaxID=400727 RepID=A0A2T7P3F6_POMCA|nr:hypothetical protein C0Q70_10533 [Pomacea canaliculata]